MVAIDSGLAILQLGSFNLWDPPRVYSELTASKDNYSTAACGSVLESTELTFEVYISGLCSMAEAQDIERQLRDELAKAPNLRLVQKETPTSNTYTNTVKSGALSLNGQYLRVRFSGNGTRPFILTLTILPTGAGAGNTSFRQVKQLAAVGSFHWASDTIGALLFDDTSTIPEELDAAVLASFVTPAEIANTGYARVTLSGKDVWPTSAGVTLVADPAVFSAMADATEPIAGMLLFQDNGSDSASRPLFLVQSFAPFQPGGLGKRIPVDLTGLF